VIGFLSWRGFMSSKMTFCGCLDFFFFIIICHAEILCEQNGSSAAGLLRFIFVRTGSLRVGCVVGGVTLGAGYQALPLLSNF
jgi:hypothetical protein